MKKKRTYICPSMSEVAVKATPLLNSASSPKRPKNRFVDDDPDYEWDEEGAN